MRKIAQKRTKPDSNHPIELSDNAKRYAQWSKAPNTLRVYKTAWREFEHFAEEHFGQALPATPQAVIEYITALADRNAAVSTIEVKLAAVAWMHRTTHHPDPTVYKAVRTVMSGIRRELKTSPTKKEPVTLEDLEAMVRSLELETVKGQRDRAMLLVGFAGAFRRSELVGITVDNVTLTEDKARILVPRSKTDQEGAGQTKTIPAIGGELGPVNALREWLDTANIASGAVFRRLDRWGNVYNDGITSQMVALVVKQAAKEAGLDWRSYSGHSLRSGFITETMDAGASDSDIMQQTGHRTERVMCGYRKDTGAGASRPVEAVSGAKSANPRSTAP